MSFRNSLLALLTLKSNRFQYSLSVRKDSGEALLPVGFIGRMSRSLCIIYKPYSQGDFGLMLRIIRSTWNFIKWKNQRIIFPAVRKCNVPFSFATSLHFPEPYFSDLSKGSDGVGGNGDGVIITISPVVKIKWVNECESALGILSKGKHCGTL